MRIAKNILVSLIGGVGYGMIEILFRGFTHPTMLFAGGLCFLAFSIISERMKSLPLLIKAFTAAMATTAIEFVFGLIFNIIFRMDVWSYSDMPLNLFGQVCPTFTLLWCGIALVFLPLADRINRTFV